MIQARYPKLTGLLVALLLALVLAACTTNPSPGEEEPEPGTLIVDITGLPDGVDGDVDVNGPGFSQSLTAGTTIDDLDAGSYSVSAESVSNGADTYGPVVSGSPANVTEGGTVTVTVDYVFLDPTTVGTLQVNIEGLSGVNGDVTVTGPGGFNQTLSATTTLTDLTPASYSVSAQNVSDGAATYEASVDVTDPVVFPEETTTVTVSYDRVATDDGDSEVNAAVYAQFRNSGPDDAFWFDEPLFNDEDVLDLEGLQYRNAVSNPGDSTDWLFFTMIHPNDTPTTISMELECDPVGDDQSPVRVTLYGDDGDNLTPGLFCGETQSYTLPSAGDTEHLVEIEAVDLGEPNYNEYILTINAHCFQQCTYTEYSP